MERDKNARLTTAEKLEEEKLKQELTDIGLYEEGISYKDMKKIIVFINESKNTSNVNASSSNSKTTQKTQHSNNECLLETNKSDTNMAQEDLQEFRELPKPSYSYRASTMLERKDVRRPNSPESSGFETPNPTYRRKSSDDDGTPEKQHESTNPAHSTNRPFPSKSGNTLRDCQTAAERNADAQGEVVQKLERWQLNPFDVTDNENDVPLRQPNRPLARERAPFEHCKNVTLDECEQVGRSVGQHLKEMADLWYSWRPAFNSEVLRWGSPIQVGTATANSSTERTPLTDTKTEQIRAECAYRDSHERVSKRKANYLIRGYADRNEEIDDEEDKEHGSARVKKKRQPNSKSSNVDRSPNQRASHEKPTSSTTAHSVTDNNSEAEPSVEQKKSVCPKRKLDEQDGRTSPELVVYPRRIVPPNPRKRLSLSRLRRGNAASRPSPRMPSIDEAAEQAKNQSKNASLTDEEIRRELLDDWPSDDKEDGTDERSVVIRPLPLSRETQKKLLSSCTPEAIKKTAASEDGDWERNRGKKLRLDEERKEPDGRMENGNGSWEHSLLSDDDDLFEVKRESDAQNGNLADNVSVSTSDDKVNCPICNKLFPQKEIEGHAADCDQFEISGDETTVKNLNVCNVCNKYKTNSGMEYENHVLNCIDEKRNEQSHESEETASTSFRTFKPISQLKDSEIDYLNQFSSKSKQTNINKKRKH